MSETILTNAIIPKSNNLLSYALIPQVYDLEDLNIQSGTFKNAGEGWNTFTFPEPFDTPPVVYARCDNYGIEIKSVTAEHFLYMVTTATSSSGSSKTLYYGKSSQYNLTGIVSVEKSGGYSWTNSGSFTVLTAAGSNGTAGVADAVDIGFIAVEKVVG